MAWVSEGARVREWRESNFGIGGEGRVGPQNVGADQKNDWGRKFGVSETYDFINFCYDSIKFYL